MKLYQAEHNNCEPYEDNYTYMEDKVYTNKEELIKRIKEEGYEEKRSGYLQDGDIYYYKDNIKDTVLFREDMITIHELEVINYTEDTLFTKLYEYLDNDNILTHHNMAINEVKSKKSKRFYITENKDLKLIWESNQILN